MPQYLVAGYIPDDFDPSQADEATGRAIHAPAESPLAGYHLFHSARGDLLMKVGRFAEAREEIHRAIAMTRNLREQELLTERLRQIEKVSARLPSLM